jgi:hypothetical protein
VIDPPNPVSAPSLTSTERPILNTATITFPTLTSTPSALPAYTYAPDEHSPAYPMSMQRILSPGDGSSVLSPLKPELSILLGSDHTVEIELLNNNGALLVKKLLYYPQVDVNQRILIQPELDFEVSGNGESGRLVVKTQDVFGRLIALTSCDLTLLMTGDPSPSPALIPYDTFLLTEPQDGDLIQGGIVEVSGYIRPVGSSMVVIEMVDENGVVISNRVLSMSSLSDGAPVAFSTTLPYLVERETHVRLILRQTRGAIPGPAVVSSILLSIR